MPSRLATVPQVVGRKVAASTSIAGRQHACRAELAENCRNRRAQKRFREKQKQRQLERRDTVMELKERLEALANEKTALASRNAILEKVFSMRARMDATACPVCLMPRLPPQQPASWQKAGTDVLSLPASTAC